MKCVSKIDEDNLIVIQVNGGEITIITNPENKAISIRNYDLDMSSYLSDDGNLVSATYPDNVFMDKSKQFYEEIGNV